MDVKSKIMWHHGQWPDVNGWSFSTACCPVWTSTAHRSATVQQQRYISGRSVYWRPARYYTSCCYCTPLTWWTSAAAKVDWWWRHRQLWTWERSAASESFPVSDNMQRIINLSIGRTQPEGKSGRRESPTETEQCQHTGSDPGAYPTQCLVVNRRSLSLPPRTKWPYLLALLQMFSVAANSQKHHAPEVTYRHFSTVFQHLPAPKHNSTVFSTEIMHFWGSVRRNIQIHKFCNNVRNI